MHLAALRAARRRGYIIVSTKEGLALANKHPKSLLAEAALHLAALATGEYDEALGDGRALARLQEEINAVKAASQ